MCVVKSGHNWKILNLSLFSQILRPSKGLYCHIGPVQAHLWLLTTWSEWIHTIYERHNTSALELRSMHVLNLNEKVRYTYIPKLLAGPVKAFQAWCIILPPLCAPWLTQTLVSLSPSVWGLSSIKLWKEPEMTGRPSVPSSVILHLCWHFRTAHDCRKDFGIKAHAYIHTRFTHMHNTA